ncbi:arylamine N-acetyltransferase family protein [Streptomyces boninensis]|uniref:arylamine N-acetyltransferase family protein n=1 Tax=Streptomyces boninensis TaxID=2039455 RepID=UPI003B21CDF5
MDSTQADAYLARIDARRPAAPTTEALRDLQLRHLTAVPFENLSIHLGEPIVLTEEALYAKLVERRRGGFCYELNGAFAALLTHLGYEVDLLAARVFTDEGRLGPPYDHMVLRVRTQDGDGPWLADVGFGRHAVRPLHAADRGEQHDPAGVFRIAEASGGPYPADDLDCHHDGRPVYRLEQRPRELAAFNATCWYQQTSPESHFARSLTCSRLTADGGRITLSGDKLITTSPGPDGGERREERLPGAAAILAAYRTHFGIDLDRVPPTPK